MARGITEILAEERTRVNAILTSPEGVRNPRLARELALQGMGLTQAASILKLSPAENPYLAAMDKEGPISIQGVRNSGLSDPRAARMAEIAEAGRQTRIAKGCPRPGDLDGQSA